LPLQLSKDVTLCIYRIIQEAVQNVVKHSGARKATVEVGVSGSDLVLIILDTGAGFDPNDARITASLGLISMRERIMAVGGTLRLNSRVGDGTVVEARITLSAEMLSSATSDEIIQVSASSH
jgi:signal transduction histidine kinase